MTWRHARGDSPRSPTAYRASFRGAPLDGYPTELPLAPAIAPGLVASSERAAAIIDNLNMMLSILEDVLVHPSVPNRRAAVNQVIAQFSNRQYRCVQTDEWIVVALRHSIFDQGGFALAPDVRVRAQCLRARPALRRQACATSLRS